MESTGKLFSSQSYSKTVLNGFSHLRSNTALCDVTLRAEDQSYHAHRALLASSSDYFRAMFTSEMKETFVEEIDLHGMTATGLEKILEFIYSGNVVLSIDNIEDILAAASYLQVTGVIEFCKEFLIAEVTLENCVDIGHIANAYNLTSVDEHVNVYMLQNFNHVSDFNKVPFERLAFLLSSNTLKGCTELQLFYAAKIWLESDLANRLQHAAALMQNIRFPLINPTDLITHVQTVDFLRSDSECMKLLLEASNYQMVPYMQPVLQTPRTRIRSDATHLVTLGGVLRHQLDVSKDLRVYDEAAKRWVNMAPMESSRYQHGIAVIGNFLFVVGGQSNYDTKGKTAVDTVFRYDPRYNKWIRVRSLNEKRTFFHLSAIEGKLYAVGGRNAAGELSTVECYNPQRNEWCFVEKMQEPHYGHAVAAFYPLNYWLDWDDGDFALKIMAHMTEISSLAFITRIFEEALPNEIVAKAKRLFLPVHLKLCKLGTVYNGQMYISGGITHDSFQKKLLCYDPDANTWMQKTPMSTVRGLHCMTTVGERLYVIGGNHFKGTTDYDDVLDCEFYTSNSEQWTAVAPMLTGQSDVGVAVFQGKIFVTGGYSWNNRCMVDIVQCYDPVEDSWAKTFSLPAALGGIRACTLTILPSFANLRTNPIQSGRAGAISSGEQEGTGDMMLSVDRPIASNRVQRAPPSHEAGERPRPQDGAI